LENFVAATTNESFVAKALKINIGICKEEIAGEV
jgi:hypothetical protein